MSKNNIAIRNVAPIGVTNIDVYGVQRRNQDSASGTTPKLLMFFRSEDHAKGLPKEDPNPKGTLSYLSNTINNIIEDKKYDQSFGFDLFREKLFGNNTKIFKINEDKNGYFIINGSSFSETDTGVTLEMLYDKTPLLLELIDGKKTYSINEEFMLKKVNSTLSDKSYYAPNIMIKPGKEVKISAKFFDTDGSSKLGQLVSFKLSNPKGIDSFTPNHTFNKNEEIAEFTIKTKPNEAVDAKTTITAFIKDATGNNDVEIGRITILPNILLEPKFIFVDVFYKKNTATSNTNYSSLAADINTKAYNQASINFVMGKSQILNVTDTDFPLTDPSNNLGKWFAQKPGTTNYETTQNDSLSNALKTLTSKFFEKIAKEILDEIEKAMQNFDIKEGSSTNKLVPQNKTLNDWFIEYSQTPDAIPSAPQWYNKLLKYLCDYADEMKLSFYPMFMCNNIITTKSTLAVGNMRAKGLIIPSNTIPDVKSIVHELGHNLGLRHTFDIPADANGDIKLKPMSTYENIMDYLSNNAVPPVNHSKNFLTYQFDRMRENLGRLKFNVEDMDFKLVKEEKVSYPDNIINDFEKNTNLIRFSKDLCSDLFEAYRTKYPSTDYDKLMSQRDKVLTKCIDIIKAYFKNL